MKGLTSKQRAILDFIQSFIDQHRYSPSYREIMHRFDLASPGSVYKYIQTLKRKGALATEDKCSRSLNIPLSISPSLPSNDIRLPFIGYLLAHYPIEMFKQSQSIAVPAFLVQVPDNTYILQVQGDTLQEEGMFDGDLILIEARQDIEAGETIVALVNQHETYVKMYYPEGQHVRLQGRRQDSLMVRHDLVFIHGVIVGLIRSYR
jgi:repressor LexA